MIAWVGLSYRVEVRNSIVETQLQIDKNIEAALVSEFPLPRSVFDNLHRIRFLFSFVILMRCFFPHLTSLTFSYVIMLLTIDILGWPRGFLVLKEYISISWV